MRHSHIYGLLVEFDNENDLLEAARFSFQHGYRRIDAFSPVVVEGLAEAIGFEHTRLPFITLMGGLAGGVAGFLLQLYINTVNYPLNIGGRPYNSWPSFIPVTFELTILGAALAVTIGMLAMNGLPTPYHPVFNVPRFALATRDRFFLCIKARDPLFDVARTREFLSELKNRGIYEIEG